MTVIKTLSKVGVTAVLAAGLAMTTQSWASADAADAAVTVTPSANLADGAVVQVAGTGLAPSSTYFVGQCAEVAAGAVACSEEGLPSVSFTTDAAGAGSTPFTVRRTFDGFLIGGGHWGTVDCTAVQCEVGVGNETGGAGALISFS
jgi:hypothetical protein